MQFKKELEIVKYLENLESKNSELDILIARVRIHFLVLSLWMIILSYNSSFVR